MIKKNIIQESVSLYHNPGLTKKVVEAFNVEINPKFPDYVWSEVSKILNLKRFYTLGLSGKFKLAWDDISARFPYVLLTNQLTNPNTYSVQQNVEGDISILAFDQNSSLNTELGGVLEIEDMIERSEPSIGVNIRYGKNKKLSSSTKEPDYERALFLRGGISSGFLLSHEDKRIYSINDISKFLEK